MSKDSHSGMIFLHTPTTRVERRGRFLIAELLVPHLVFSTCQASGGERDDLRYLVNHQSTEGAGHGDRGHAILDMGQIPYQRSICQELSLPPEQTALMGTAANMQYAALAQAAYEEFSVACITTAGVTGNATRAGDPARWVERCGRCQPVTQQGTINTMLFFNVPLTHAALCRAIVTTTEAKTAILQELAVPSRSSHGLATGTGTDQFCVAAPLGAEPGITWTGAHCKMGELIAQAAGDSLREALRWQNGLESSYTRDICHALGRHGLSEKMLHARLTERLDDEAYVFFRDNEKSIRYEPQVAGCAYAIASLLDRLHYGTLPTGCAEELILNQAALMAATLAARPEAFSEFHSRLAAETEAPIERIISALALGWQEKWA